jgi:hypothetical protein
VDGTKSFTLLFPSPFGLRFFLPQSHRRTRHRAPIVVQVRQFVPSASGFVDVLPPSAVSTRRGVVAGNFATQGRPSGEVARPLQVVTEQAPGIPAPPTSPLRHYVGPDRTHFARAGPTNLTSPQRTRPPENQQSEPTTTVFGVAMPITTAKEVVAQPVSWLWPQRLPLGKLVILDGDPDLGKSLLSLDLCARLSTGRPFPDGGLGPGPANALVLSAEDTAADTIVPRLHRLGADLQRVFVWQRQGDDEGWPWHFPADAGWLDDALARTDARLAVIDPVMAFLDDSVLSASDQSVRRALGPLMHLADKHRCTLLMLRHLRKQGGPKALYRGLGSIAFVAACRFAMQVARDPLITGQCVLAAVRNSLGGPQPSLAYRITAADGGLPAVEWLGASPVSADALLGGRGDEGARGRAAAFLEQFLAGGPRTSHDIWQAAQKAGLSARTVERAKPGVGIRCRRVHVEGRFVSYWLLPGQQLPAELAGDDDLSPWLEKLERQFPPRTPLDEEELEVADEGD